MLLAVLLSIVLVFEPTILTWVREFILCKQRFEPGRICDDSGETMLVTVTAYSSTPDQTDDSPFVMANGERVHDGAVAANFLPIGTQVMLPETHGRKVFTVKDRKNKRFNGKPYIDIWMESREEALEFGIRQIPMKIL